MAYILPQLLIAAAERFPEKAALAFQNQRLSYSELDEASNRLAHALKKNGVRRGDRVGIFINKSLPAYVSVFGILKADAVYVPLDPGAPAKRLSYIINNCGIHCLLSAANKIEQLEQIGAEGAPLQRVILVDNQPSPVREADRFPKRLAGAAVVPWREVLQENPRCPELTSIETDLAYILYTSGSTGEPKGVMISHRNALTFIDWAFDVIRIQPEDRVSNHAPLHFDLSIFDIFAAVKGGATISPVPAETAKFPVKLSEFISQEKISVWYSVPSAWVHLLGRGQIEKFDFSSLRAIIFAGEVFPTKHLRQLMQTIPRATYYNWYGPTETNVITSYEVKQPPPTDDPIPIGKPCANMEVFALDEQGKVVCEPGVVGELYGRGPCVAQGYWNDPAKTESRFVRNPLQPHFLDRAYKTGDLVKLDAAGNYHYLGRRDHQVKVQGYRIELGEIETALLSYPEVEEAAVVAMKNEQQMTYLKAFVVGRRGRRLDEVELKRHCAQQVPKYMIPEVIELREALPKTSTGKTDKQSLLNL
jgi:amino acid adenylation domain-containing protein